MMHTFTRSLTIIGCSTALLLSALVPTFAGSTGRKNTAIVLTAATVHQVLQKKTTNAVVLGLASALAWNNYENTRKYEGRQYSYATYNKRGHSQPRGHAYGHYKNRGNGNHRGNDNHQGNDD